jgi:hypothetical protein
MTPDPPQRPETREDVVFRRLGDEFAILDPDGQVIHVLNPTAAAVWVLCDGTQDLPAIAREVAAAFGTAADAALQADVAGAVSAFAERGLLR